MDVRGHNGNGQNKMKTGSNCVCSFALCCPCCCGSYNIPIIRVSDKKKVATISRPQLTCMQVCGKMNEMVINWADVELSDAEKHVIISMCYTLEFEFFSPGSN